MSRTVKIVLGIISAIMLASMLFYPFGYDQSVFSVGGELMVSHGRVPFRDFLDTKPPLIFLIYGIASFLFGHHEWSIRLLDVLYQFGTLWYLYIVLRRSLADEQLAFGSVVAYCFLYPLCGFWMTAQAESFAFLPMVLLYDVTERTAEGQSPLRNGMIVGLIAVLLLLLKSTLIVAPFAALTYLLIYIPNQKAIKWKYFAGLMSGAIVAIAITLAYLIQSGAYVRAMEWLGWVQSYSTITDRSVSEAFYRTFPIGLIAAFGISTVMMAALGGYLLAQRKTTVQRTFIHLSLQIIFALIAVLLERKYFPYQYGRIYWAAAPFVAIGFAALYKKWMSSVKTQWVRSSGNRWFQLAGLCLVAVIILFYSQLPRMFSQPLHWIQIRMTNADYAQDVENQFGKSYYKEQIIVSDSIKTKISPNDRVYLWGNSVGIYWRLAHYAPFFGLTNTPLGTELTPMQWKAALLDSLTVAPPKLFICELEDDRSYITGDSLDSWQRLQRWQGLRDFVTLNYTEWKTIGHFRIFEKNTK